MAKARASHRWTDGSITTFEVEVAMSYPDALDQAKHVALVGFREMLEVMQTEDES